VRKRDNAPGLPYFAGMLQRLALLQKPCEPHRLLYRQKLIPAVSVADNTAFPNRNQPCPHWFFRF
ncbi:hypothetical protein BAV2680, partial [Bordetella avium 197N]